MDRFTKYCKPAMLAEGWKEDKRLSKDEYYLGFAKAAAVRGTCLRRNYGAVIVKNDEIQNTIQNLSLKYGATNVYNLLYDFFANLSK